jgi:hypothetical protein
MTEITFNKKEKTDKDIRKEIGIVDNLNNERVATLEEKPLSYETEELSEIEIAYNKGYEEGSINTAIVKNEKIELLKKNIIKENNLIVNAVKEKPLKRKRRQLISGSFIYDEENVAQAVERLKDFAPYDYRDINRLNEYINEIFGDLQ